MKHYNVTIKAKGKKWYFSTERPYKWPFTTVKKNAHVFDGMADVKQHTAQLKTAKFYSPEMVVGYELVTEKPTPLQKKRQQRGMQRREITKRYGQRILTANAKKRRKNPSSRDTQKAAQLFEEFTGHDADEKVLIEIPDYPEVLTAVGTCVAIAYETTRDGETAQYQHEFKKSAAPLLCASPDGRQLFLIGGAFKFRDTGINDD